MNGEVSRYFDLETLTRKVLADTPQTHSLPEVIFRIAHKGDRESFIEPEKTG
jgi:hypothetical protein